MIYLIVFLVLLGVIVSYEEARGFFWAIIQTIFLAIGWALKMIFNGLIVLLPIALLLFLLIAVFGK
jgi:hypothetical protein